MEEENRKFIFAKEPTIYIIHENDKWMEPLREAFEKLGVPFVEWHLGQGGSFDLSTPPPEGVFYSRMSASSHTRGHRYAAEHTHTVLEWLELYGRKVINGSRALSLEISKIRQYRSLEKLGIKVPHTVVVTSNLEDGKERYVNQITTAAKKAFPDGIPFITKHNRSGRGVGVRLFKEHQYLKTYLEGPEYEIPVDGISLLQEYIESTDSSVIRCEFIGGKFIYALRINTSDGFENCPADYCSLIQNFKTKFEIIKDFDHPIVSEYQRFLRENHIEIAGVEFVVDKEGNIFTFDVNTNTNYNSTAEKTAYGGMVGMLEIAKFLHQELQQAIGLELPLEHEITNASHSSDCQEETAIAQGSYGFTYPRKILSGLGHLLNGVARTVGLTAG